MKNANKRWVATLVAISLSYAGALQSAQAALVATEQVAAEQGVVSIDAQAMQQRAHVLSYLDRPDVIAGLQERGVEAEQARERVAALTDAEVAQVAHTLDTAPAGAGPSILGTIVFIFVVLLVTDILGLTKIFPFTRSVR
ncbi:MAG: PA2779 family protein [Methylibium sp.]|uniref:PA2779 family protein n=1 Tax=Methylibium sp. TaxID=2067992 RepID=UPI00178DB62D|nr:PA2779 family protein [Methylibium sp.]MBA3597433.1 PA2779 family protein [Methylibium sp.]